MNSVRSNNLSLRFKPSGCKDIGIRTFKFVAKTQFLSVAIKKAKLVLSLKPQSLNQIK